ncbi:helix-turn-helix domain-containing protein [Kitasatospora cinereorecta]|uniref:Transposase n=1 Tax=Kitasatospora cinereorecta TaxID=285560 RepID=A0ABW0VBG9_9ACTN
MEEGRRLQRIGRSSKDPIRLRRAIMVVMSAQGQPVWSITSLLQVSEGYVRDVIHAFNERGFDALDPRWSGGRPRTIGDQVRERICLIARTSPADWGIAEFSAWSLAKLAEHLVAG